MNGSQQQRVLQATVPALYLGYLPKGYEERARQYFGYVTEALGLGGGATVNPATAINGDADFLVVAITGSARDPAAVTTRFFAPAVTLQINNSTTGRNFWSRPVDWINTVGTAELPMYLPYPYFIRASSELVVSYVNFSPAVGGQPYDCRILLHGFKVFPFGPDEE